MQLETTNLKTKSAIYKHCTGHLELSMAFNVVAAGCTNRKFEKNDLVIVLQELPGVEDKMLGALAIANGNISTLSWKDVWVNWEPNKPEKVCVNEVKFITRPVLIDKEVYGNLTQTDIALDKRADVISHILAKGA